MARRGTFALALMAITGCSGENAAVGDEDIGSVEQAFGASSCGTATADRVFEWHIFGGLGHKSPSSYDTCFRGYVVDVAGLLPSKDLSAVWDGPPLTSQAACEASWGAAVFYKKVGGSWVAQSTLERYGRWLRDGDGTYFCAEPALVLANPEAYADWRIAATMRTRYGGSILRPIWFKHRRT